jgi:hypothetical protein
VYRSIDALLSSLLLALAVPAAADDSATGELRGTLRLNSGKPAAYASIFVVGTRRGAQVDEKGRFRITQVPAGIQTVRVNSIGFAPAQDTVAVPAGGSRDLDLLFSDPWRLKGRPQVEPREVRLGEDCGGRLHDHYRDLSGLRHFAAANAAGSFSLAVDPRHPWDLTCSYQLRIPGTPLTIAVLDHCPRVVRTLRAGPGKAAADVTWNVRDDAGLVCDDGRYSICFSTPTDTLTLDCCLHEPFPPPPIEY